jgi:4-diphosphocytidyl-2-C-methyl-D-erythritol kinase
MRGPARPRGVRVEARAKLNLGLAVGPARPDGFHEIATFFQSISLADTLWVEPRARGFSLAVRHEEAALRGRTPTGGDAAVPRGAGNLVLRAAALLAERAGLDRGARFTLVKRIPPRAGLGGGSADAAAALRGLAALYALRVGTSALSELALELGSDVPFALIGGTAFGLGRGERLRRLALARPFRALVAVPRWRVSTAQAYARIDRRKYVLTAWKSKLRSAQLLGRKRLRAGAALRLGNTFEEALGDRRSDLFSLRARIREAGATEARMTGSGSAVFGVLGPGVSDVDVAGRFTGSETLYLVRSARTGLRLRKLP